jgi:hypothetical protein
MPSKIFEVKRLFILENSNSLKIQILSFHRFEKIIVKKHLSKINS